MGKREGAGLSVWRSVQVLLLQVNAVSMSRVKTCMLSVCVRFVAAACCCVKHISSLRFQDSPLILQSDRNVTVNARNDQGQLTGQLTVGKTYTWSVNAAVYGCSTLPAVNIIRQKQTELDHFVQDSHLCCFACAWILKCVLPHSLWQSKCYPFPLVHLTEADSHALVSAKSFFQALIELVRSHCPTVNVAQRTHDIYF